MERTSERSQTLPDERAGGVNTLRRFLVVLAPEFLAPGAVDRTYTLVPHAGESLSAAEHEHRQERHKQKHFGNLL